MAFEKFTKAGRKPSSTKLFITTHENYIIISVRARDILNNPSFFYLLWNKDTNQIGIKECINDEDRKVMHRISKQGQIYCPEFIKTFKIKPKQKRVECEFVDGILICKVETEDQADENQN